MAVLTPAQFEAKWHPLFPDNFTGQITESTLREYVTDIKDSFLTTADKPGQATSANLGIVRLAELLDLSDPNANQKVIPVGTMLNILQNLYSDLSASGHNHDGIYIQPSELLSVIRAVAQAATDKAVSEKAIAESLAKFRYQIKFPTGITEDYNDTSDVNEEITAVVPGSMISTIQYRKNAGAWSNTYPFQRTPADIVDWKVTFQPGKNAGSFTVKGRVI